MRKNMKKSARITALALSTAMLLSACGQEAVEQSSESSKTSSEQQETSSSVDEVVEKPYWEMLDEVSDSSELPDWDGEILEVSMWYANGNDYVFGEISPDNVTFKELERVTGIRFNLEDSYGNGGDSIDGKLPKMLAGKDFPTMVISQNTPTQMRDLYDNGYLVDLTSYYEDGSLDQLQRRIPTELFGDTYYQNLRTEDGKYYLLPDDSQGVVLRYWNNVDFEVDGFDPDIQAKYLATGTHLNALATNNAISVREDILLALYPDALTMADIQKIWKEDGTFTYEQVFDIGLKSPEDFYQLLYDIQELLESGDYKGLDGKPMEVTFGPHSETDNWDWMYNLPNMLSPMYSQFDYFSMFDANQTDPDKMLVSGWETDFYQEHMKKLNQLVNDDIIAKNSLVDNGATFTEKHLNGHYAVLYGSASGNKVPDNEEWDYRTIWVDTPANTDYNTVKGLAAPKYWGIFADSVTEEQVEQIVHAYNYMASDIGALAMTWGPEDAGLWELDENGVRKFVDAELENNIMYGVDSEIGWKYGIKGGKCSTKTQFSTAFYGTAVIYNACNYLRANVKERSESDAYSRFAPSLLGGEYVFDQNDGDFVKQVFTFYSWGIAQVPSLKTFWGARNGFENQMKKVIAAAPENFDKEMQELKTYCLENGWDDAAMLEYNQKWVAANEKELKDAGYLK